jgi:arsenite-transporting ATPase
MWLLSGEIKGVARLREVGKMFFEGVNEAVSNQRISESASQRARIDLRAPAIDVLSRVSPNGHRRAVFFAGKGGVGKTVASCITAVWLARQDYKTLRLWCMKG